MIELKSEFESGSQAVLHNLMPVAFHSTFYPVYDKLKKWFDRFPLSGDGSNFHDLTILYLLATKKFLDHRDAPHIFRFSLSMHFMQKNLLRAATFSPNTRHLEVRSIPTNLRFPFSSKPVLGCLIGFNVLDRYEIFDEENIVLALRKYLPELRLVKDSSYCHTSQHKNIKIFYFEIEKKDNTPFSLEEQRVVKRNLASKVAKSIQQLSPTIYMGLNDEVVYKNILALSQEIQSLQDLPQAYITFDQQTGKEIVFKVILVHITPFHRFSLKDRFFDSNFEGERVLNVRQIHNHPIEANIFRLSLPREPALLRADGSLNFYFARQKIVGLMKAAIGEFRDFNGGILIKQQEMLEKFTEHFASVANEDVELVENFFYEIAPVEKQVLLSEETLVSLFDYFQEARSQELAEGSTYSLQVQHKNDTVFIVVRGKQPSIKASILSMLSEYASQIQIDVAYNVVETSEGTFFNCVILESSKAAGLLQALQEQLQKWHTNINSHQVLRIGLEYSLVSLDPRIGGETHSGDVLRLLFEGLTRFNQTDRVENGVAESIQVSSNGKTYTFKLRSSFWNDGSPVTAHDFEYAWKKVLSPDFKTAFAYLFYPIKNAQEAKEGIVPLDAIGIEVVNDRTLKVELVNPVPYFLQLTAHSVYSPVNRLIDQQYPQWPYQAEKGYPCNGPFQLKFNQPNQGYQLVKNKFYWDVNNIPLDQIILTQMGPAQALQSFQKKEIDLIGSPFGVWHSLYTTQKEGQRVSFSNTSVAWCALNTASEPLKNIKIRQALAHAVDRAKLIENAYIPLNPAYSPLLPHCHENSKSLFPEYDEEKAIALFKEGLEELKLTKKNFPALSLLFHDKGIQGYAAPRLQAQLKKCLGIEVILKPMPWKNVFNKLVEGDFHLGLIHWTHWVDDPIYSLNVFRTANQELNFSRWENPHFKEYVDLSESEVNPFQRSSHLFKAEKYLSKEVPIIPLFYQPFMSLTKKELKLTFRTPSGPYNIARSSFKQGGLL